MYKAIDVKNALRALSDPERAKASMWFFKTEKGQYGAHDRFISVRVPQQRTVSKKFAQLSLPEIEKLLHSAEHEFRLTALFIMVGQFKKGDVQIRKQLYDLYIHNMRWVNNWDLVDTSAGYIVGAWLEEKKEKMTVLKRLARSNELWERRIAMIATFHFIYKGESKEAFTIAEILLHDSHDLIQKAVGWMLREVGKRVSAKALMTFLELHAATMPRTALRYAIEHFTPAQKRHFMDAKKNA